MYVYQLVFVLGVCMQTKFKMFIMKHTTVSSIFTNHIAYIHCISQGLLFSRFLYVSLQATYSLVYMASVTLTHFTP
jgi:hypothetical protein